MPNKRRVDTVVGEGKVLRPDGTSLGFRPYSLTRWRPVHDDDLGEAIEGTISIDVHVDWKPSEAESLIGQSLTLELEDGRRLPFFVANTRGQIAPIGELK